MLTKLQIKLRRRLRRRLGPVDPPLVTPQQLQADAADYFGLPLRDVQQRYQEYRALHEQNEYAARFGESKTLCFEEAFLVFVAATLVRPSHTVEIGTQYGNSTRRIVDMLDHLGLNKKVICFDISDDITYVDHNEIDLHIQDITHTFAERVLTPYAPSLIFLDARPYHLLKNVISTFLSWSTTHPSILVIHDCCPSLYFPLMLLSKNNPGVITSKTGVWERHALADVFHAPNRALDDLRTPTHRLRIFGTPHGLALIAPLTLLEQQQAEHDDA